MNWKPLATGILALIVLEVLVSTPTGPVSSLLALPAAWAKKLIDPTVPLIGHGSALTGAATAATTNAAPSVAETPAGPTNTSPAQQLLLKGAP